MHVRRVDPSGRGRARRECPLLAIEGSGCWFGTRRDLATTGSGTDTCYFPGFGVVHYESLKRELKTKPKKECRCDERLQTRVEESTRLACPRLVAELEHLKIETRLIDEMFASEMGEYVFFSLFIMNR